MKKLLSLLAIILTLTAISACKKPGESTGDEAIKRYILAHPEVLVESLEKYQRQQAEGDEKQVAETIAKRADDIYKNPNSPVVGNPNGKKVMIEFFDYNCHYCKAVLPDLKRIIADDKDLKVIFKELPILGPTSGTAAIAALIVHDIAPEKYFAFHTSLMSGQGPVSDESIMAAAKAANIDPAQIQKKMKEKKYQDILSANVDLAHALGISGTPTFIVNHHVVRGAARYEAMKEELKKD